METLNERIKKLRKEHGLTQLQLAEKLNVTDKAVSKWEVGEANPDISLLVSISTLFGVSIDYLLTGKEAEEKVVVMSNVELCCKEDDVERFNKLTSYYDDFGVSIIEYAKKYESKNILNEIAEKYNNGLIKLNIEDFAPILLKLNMFEALLNAKMLDYDVNYNSRISGRASLYYKKEQLYPQTSSKDCETYRDKYGNRQILFDNWPTDTQILDYYFSFKSLDSKMHKLKQTHHTKIDSSFFIDVDYSGVLYDFLTMAIDAKDIDKIEFLWPYAKKHNELIKLELEKKKANHESILLDYKPGRIYNGGSQKYHLVSLSTLQVIELLKLGLIDIAKEANIDAHIKRGWLNWEHSTVEENQFKKYEVIKNNKGKYVDTRIFDVKLKDIIIIYRLLDTKDPKYIIETLQNNPVFYSEYLYELFKKNDYKKLYEFAVENNLELAEGLFKTNRIRNVLNLITDFIKFEFRYTASPRNTIGYNPMYDMPLYELEKVDEQNISRIFKNNKERNEITFYEFEKNPSFYKDDANQNSKLLETIENAIKIIKDGKQSIISDQETKIQLNEMIKGKYNKEFFMSEISKNNEENCIIKLCTLFEVKLKAKGMTGDFSEMLNEYCKKFWGDDGWGYNVCRDKHKVDILNRLRMQRNNILHAEDKKVQPLTTEELIECVDEICDWEVK